MPYKNPSAKTLYMRQYMATRRAALKPPAFDAAVSPAGIAWVPNDTLKGILAEVRATFPPTPLLRGGDFLIGGRRARVNFQPELA